MTGNLPNILEKSDTSSIINKTLLQLIEGVTGLASSNRKDLILSVGHLFQSMLTGKFLSILKDEWDDLRAKGRIKENYQETEQHRTCLKEMLDFLDSDKPDEARFSFMKKIFLMASTESVYDRDSVLPQQYMRICRELSSAEIFIISSAYELSKNNEWNKDESNAVRWLEKVAEYSGLDQPDLVDFYDQILINKKLLTPRSHTDRSGIFQGENCRLTNLAQDICRFIEEYDKINESKIEN
jgi:hypothetical protein